MLFNIAGDQFPHPHLKVVANNTYQFHKFLDIDLQRKHICVLKLFPEKYVYCWYFSF
jgi:hypothetical protein